MTAGCAKRYPNLPIEYLLMLIKAKLRNARIHLVAIGDFEFIEF